jgi:hypothetical protein
LFDLAEGLHRLISHQTGLYDIPTAAGSKSAPLPICCCSVWRPSASRRPAASTICPAAAPARSEIRSASGFFVNGINVFDGTAYCRLAKRPGQVLDRFLPTAPAAMRSAAE